VHVANSWYHDIAPARALGVRHVWLDRERTGEDPGATVQVDRATDVAGAIERLAGIDMPSVDHRSAVGASV
jgi:FMN phosphatase YigB (HAD superfamily)